MYSKLIVGEICERHRHYQRGPKEDKKSCDFMESLLHAWDYGRLADLAQPRKSVGPKPRSLARQPFPEFGEPAGESGSCGHAAVSKSILRTGWIPLGAFGVGHRQDIPADISPQKPHSVTGSLCA